MTAAHARTAAVMGTIVSIHVQDGAGEVSDGPACEAALDRALDWFHLIEATCSRFDPHSELRQLTAQIGVAVPVSASLFEAVRFALSVAEETDGAFDPTVGRLMELSGFNREHRTGRIVETDAASAQASYRDVHIDVDRHTVTLDRSLMLDLGAVAKGLAIDMAANELRPFRDFAIDAGGDLYMGGHNAHGEAWSVGIRHPRQDRALIESVRVSDRAVCTSGDYERRSSTDLDARHILDPRTGGSATALASVTVVAPTAMVADALATAAFVMGPVDGLHLLERFNVNGVMFSQALDRFATGLIFRESSQP